MVRSSARGLNLFSVNNKKSLTLGLFVVKFMCMDSAVRSSKREIKMQVLNPAWKQYQDVVNEGGEGFNPHPKYITRQSVPAVAKPVATASSRMVKDERGNTVPAAKMAERLAKDEARLAKITNESARAITQASIDFARAALAA